MITTTINSVRRIVFWQQSENGVLTVFPCGDPQGVPFPLARLFTITGVPDSGKRGKHAHRGCSQLLACLTGAVEVSIDDSRDTEAISLRPDGAGILIPPLLWNVVTFADPSTVLAVFCDEPYDAADYIRDHDEYMRLKLGHGREHSKTTK